MVSIDQAHTLLDEIASELPPEFWQALNGGVSLLPDTRHNKNALANDLYTLGEYCVHPVLGRYINIYYGSFERAFGDCTPEKMKKHLRDVLFHEFTHHVESLAGERGLEIKDAQQMRDYYASHTDGKWSSSAKDDSAADDTYEIRPATSADLTGMFTLYEQLFSEMAALQPAYYRQTCQNTAFIHSILDSSVADVLVAVNAHNVVLGLALVQEKETLPYDCLVPHRYASLMDLVVLTRERRQGIGTELVAAVKDWARERDLAYLQLQALSNNTSAITLYEAEGFAPALQTMIAPL